jgi:hypothetical protein
MTLLVHWYGTTDLSSAYSFLTTKNFLPYDVKLDKLPLKLQKKIDDGIKVTKNEESTLRSFEEMRQDLAKAPEDRCRKTEVKELHEIDECALIIGSEKLDIELISDSSEE